MKSLILTTKFTHTKIRFSLGIGFLVLLILAVFSHSDLSQLAADLQHLILTMVPELKLVHISWIALFILALGYYPYRKSRGKKKAEKIRMALASDLHDDLGSILNSVNIYTELALLKGESPYLHKIKESTQEAINSVRDIIWQLDDTDPSFSNLISRIECFASFLCSVKQISFKIDVAKEAFEYQFQEEEKRNLYMIIKEAINNTVKHANAANIELQIMFEKGKPIIEIRDNGKGYHQSGNSRGNGTKNMQTRASCIRYHIDIQSNAGTLIRLQKK